MGLLALLPTLGTLGTLGTMLLFMLEAGEVKHMGCDVTDGKGFTEFKPQGKLLEPNGVVSLESQLFVYYE